MIEAVQLNVSLVRHEDLRMTFTFRTEGRPVDITGWEAAFAIATAPGATPLLELGMAANGNGSRFEIVDATAGVLELFVDKADNAALGQTTTRRLAYDILVTHVDGDVNRFFYGEYVIDPGVA